MPEKEKIIYKLETLKIISGKKTVSDFINDIIEDIKKL